MSYRIGPIEVGSCGALIVIKLVEVVVVVVAVTGVARLGD